MASEFEIVSESGHAGGAAPLTLVEIGDVCAREQARSSALFERLGSWVVTTDQPRLQRLFATACHRHAWHAELWSDRAPAIPVPANAAAAPVIAEADTDADRWAAYAAALGVLIGDLTALRTRVDRELDPSTARVLDLVVADLRQHVATVTDIRV